MSPVLPLDPAKHAEYREKIREARARQGATIPKGSKFTAQHRANLKAAFAKSAKYQATRGLVTVFKGGFIDKNGYRVLRAKGKQIFEHRHVMQTMLGRPLLPQETVHHKNGMRSDNRPENLELWASGNPRGQRVEDKVLFALEILALYGELVGVFDDEKSLDIEDEFHS